MAKDTAKNTDTKPVTPDSPAKSETSQADNSRITPAQPSKTEKSRYWLLGVGGLTFFVLLLVSFAAGRAVRSLDNDDMHTVRFSMSGDAERMPSTSDGGFSTRGGMLSIYDSDTTSMTRVSGVVTKVSGNTITVAGNGTTTEVEVSDNTIYRGDADSAKVNDSIVAIGATNSDDVLIASTVRLSRE